jgi:hypothetical protein
VIQEFLQETPPIGSKPVGLDGLDGLARQRGAPLGIPVVPEDHFAPAAPPREAAPIAPYHVVDALPFLDMRLDVFARQGQSLELRVLWWPATLWFVPTEADARRLSLEGVSRGRIWTARELMDLLGCAGLRPDQVKGVALAKLELSGDIVEVRPR